MSQKLLQRPKVFGNLFAEVVRRGLCVGCGACVSVCPVASLSMVGDKPRLTGMCIACQMCYNNCPRSYFSEEEVEERIFGRRRGGEEETYLGVYRACYAARSKDEEVLSRCQDGGAVTSILMQLMRDDPGLCAVVASVDTGSDWLPRPVVATSVDELLEGAGTKYTPSPTLLGLRSAVREYGRERVAVVGTPCQIRALRKMQTSPFSPLRLAESVELAIGLFCMETFDHGKLIEYLKGAGLDPSKITRFDIKKGRFMAFEGEELVFKVPLKKMADLVRSCCHSCTDFTSEFADISVGSVGSPEGWSTVIVRTERGERALGKAVKAGVLEVKPLGEVKPGLKAVLKLAKGKREKAEGSATA